MSESRVRAIALDSETISWKELRTKLCDRFRFHRTASSHSGNNKRADDQTFLEGWLQGKRLVETDIIYCWDGTADVILLRRLPLNNGELMAEQQWLDHQTAVELCGSSRWFDVGTKQRQLTTTEPTVLESSMSERDRTRSPSVASNSEFERFDRERRRRHRVDCQTKRPTTQSGRY